MSYLTLFADGDLPKWLARFADPDIILAITFPVCALIGTVWVVTLIIRHRERMAKIEHGIDPDARG